MENINILYTSFNLLPKFGKINESFRCSNCNKYSLFIKESCHGTICSKCQVKQQICPICNINFFSEDLSENRRNQFNSIIFLCCFRDLGCEFEFTADKPEHSCPKSHYQCNQCNQTVSRLNPNHHCQSNQISELEKTVNLLQYELSLIKESRNEVEATLQKLQPILEQQYNEFGYLINSLSSELKLLSSKLNRFIPFLTQIETICKSEHNSKQLNTEVNYNILQKEHRKAIESLDCKISNELEIVKEDLRGRKESNHLLHYKQIRRGNQECYAVKYETGKISGERVREGNLSGGLCFETVIREVKQEVEVLRE